MNEDNSIVSTPLPRLKIRETIGQSFKSTWNNFIPKAGLTICFGIFYFLAFAAIIITNLILAGGSISDWLQTSASSFSISYIPQTTKQMVTFFMTMIGFAILIAYVGSIVLAAFMKLTLSETKISLAEALRDNKGRRFKFFLLLVVTQFIVSGATFFFIIPGIYYFIAFSLASFIFIEERVGVKEALLKSKAYVKGNWFKVFFTLIMGAVLYTGASLIVTYALIALSAVVASVAPNSATFVTGLFYFAAMVIQIFLGFFIFSVVAATYKKLKLLKPAPVTGGSLTKPIIMAFIGLVVWFGVFWLMSKAGDNLSSARQKAEEAARQTLLAEQAAREASSDAPYGSMTRSEGSGANRHMIYEGYGITFTFDDEWISFGPSKGSIETFMAAKSLEADNKDVYKGGILIFLLDGAAFGTADTYTIAMESEDAILKKEKESGVTDSYRIYKWSTDSKVAVVEINSTNKTSNFKLKERRYYIKPEGHKDVFVFYTIDDTSDFSSTDLQTTKMIRSIEKGPDFLK